MRTIPVRTDSFTFEAAETAARPVLDYKVDGRPQARDEATGLPLWQVRLLITSDTSIEDAAVKFPAPEAPGFALRARILVEGLVATPYVNGTSVSVTLRASKLVAAPARQGS